MEDELAKRMAARKLHGVDDPEKARAMANAGEVARNRAKVLWERVPKGPGPVYDSYTRSTMERWREASEAIEGLENEAGFLYDARAKVDTMTDQEVAEALKQTNEQFDWNPPLGVARKKLLALYYALVEKKRRSFDKGDQKAA